MHQSFHEQMVSSIAKTLDEDEKIVLINGISKLNQFFNQKNANH
jgi:hypothetical protein